MEPDDSAGLIDAAVSKLGFDLRQLGLQVVPLVDDGLRCGGHGVLRFAPGLEAADQAGMFVDDVPSQLGLVHELGLRDSDLRVYGGEDDLLFKLP